MANTITGRIIAIGETTQIPTRSDKPLYKRDVTIDCTRRDPVTGERSKYENTPQLEFTGDGCRDLDSFRAGDVVTISFEVNGSRYTDRSGQQKIFTRIRAYRIERYQTAPEPQPQPQPQPMPQFPPQPIQGELPF